MNRYRSLGSSPVVMFLAAMLSLASQFGTASAHDIPTDVILHGYVKPEKNRLHVVVRIPLVLLQNLNIPQRGPGYLDLTRIGTLLETAAGGIGKEIILYERGTPLRPIRTRARISRPSDRSFKTYPHALANIEGSELPVETNVFWNQGFLDVHLEYPIRSEQSDFFLRMLFTGFGKTVKLRVQFIPPEGLPRSYELLGGSGLMALDPRWHQAAWVFIKFGFLHIFAGIDHLLFLLCLVVPYRKVRSLVPVITSFTIAHSITLIAAAYGAVPASAWFPPLVETLIALSIFYMAIENILKVNLRRRWIITTVFGLVHGFGFSFILHQDLQFAGSHVLLSLLSFNLGVEFGQLVFLFIVLPLLTLLFRHPLATRYGVVALSLLLAHTGWHWMVDQGNTFWRRVPWPIIEMPSVIIFAGWILIPVACWAAWRIAGPHARRFLPRISSTKENLATKDD